MREEVVVASGNRVDATVVVATQREFRSHRQPVRDAALLTVTDGHAAKTAHSQESRS
jgi:hypothetical protein